MAGFGSLCIDVLCAIVPRTSAWLPIYRPRTPVRGDEVAQFPHSPMGVHPRTTLQQESSKVPNKRRAFHSTRQIIRATAGSFRWNVLLAKSSNHREGPQGISAESSDRVSMENGGRAGSAPERKRAHARAMCYLLSTDFFPGTTLLPTVRNDVLYSAV